MCDVFAPSWTPSAGRAIDCLSLKESYRTFTADVTNACFHVDEDEECYADPRAEWLEQHPALGTRPLCSGDCEHNCMTGDALEHAG